MASYKGWTKMDDNSWRHDGNNQGANKLNIVIKDEDEFKNIGLHVSDVEGRLNAEKYLLIYTVNDSPSDYDSGSHILDEFDTIDEAKKAASQVQKDNPNDAPV